MKSFDSRISAKLHILYGSINYSIELASLNLLAVYHSRMYNKPNNKS